MSFSSRAERLRAFIAGDPVAIGEYRSNLARSPVPVNNYFDSSFGQVVAHVTQTPHDLAVALGNSNFAAIDDAFTDKLLKIIGVWDQLTQIDDSEAIPHDVLSSAQNLARSLSVDIAEQAAYSAIPAKLGFLAAFVGRGIVGFTEHKLVKDNAGIDIKVAVTLAGPASPESFHNGLANAIGKAIDHFSAGSTINISGFDVIVQGKTLGGEQRVA